jgi:hypothetical protein
MLGQDLIMLPHPVHRRPRYCTPIPDAGRYELSIVEPLLVALPPYCRFLLRRILLGVADTGARIVTMRWFVKYWGKLEAEERALLSDVLAKEQLDGCWLAATVLTSSAPPGSHAEQMCGDAQVLEGTVEEIEKALGTELFSACIRMYRGRALQRIQVKGLPDLPSAAAASIEVYMCFGGPHTWPAEQRDVQLHRRR